VKQLEENDRETGNKELNTGADREGWDRGGRVKLRQR
jgi:hypothetical protein